VLPPKTRKFANRKEISIMKLCALRTCKHAICGRIRTKGSRKGEEKKKERLIGKQLKKKRESRKNKEGEKEKQKPNQ